MLVQLAYESQVVFNSICHIPLIVHDTEDKDLSALVEYHVVLSLSHSIMLSFDWCHMCNSHSNWWVCILSVKVPGGYYILAAFPCKSLAHIELASLDSIFKEFNHGTVALFILVHLVEPLDTMGFCGTLIGWESGDAYTHHWDDLCTEFADVSEPLSTVQ